MAQELFRDNHDLLRYIQLIVRLHIGITGGGPSNFDAKMLPKMDKIRQKNKNKKCQKLKSCSKIRILVKFLIVDKIFYF